MINPAKNISQQYGNNKDRHSISADVLVDEDVGSPTFIYDGYIHEIKTGIYDSSHKLIYIALLLNSNYYIYILKDRKISNLTN